MMTRRCHSERSRGIRICAVAVAWLLLATSASAQQAPWTEIKIKSAKLGTTRSLYVATPAAYIDANRRFPVLVLLDADDREQFTSAIANVRFLTSRAAIPPLIIVGVPNGKDRTHDLTPSALGENAKQFATAGGAGAFVDFIVNEALPEIRAKYRTQPSTILAGHSFGGLVALHAAATRDAFMGIVAMSPSLWWNDSTAAQGYADSLSHVTRALRLFATSGEFEPVISGPTRRFAASLDAVKPKQLAFSYRHYDDDNHGMTPLRSLVEGLRFIFAPISLVSAPIATLGPKSDSADVMHAYVATRDTYATNARALGMNAALPEDQVNQLAYGALQFFKLPRLALWLFQQNVADYPKSPNVYDSLGDGYLAIADSTNARAQFRHAIEVASQNHQPPNSDTRKKLAALTPTARR